MREHLLTCFRRKTQLKSLSSTRNWTVIVWKLIGILVYCKSRNKLKKKVLHFFLSPIFDGVYATGSEYPKRKNRKVGSEFIFSLCFSGILLILKGQYAKEFFSQKFQTISDRLGIDRNFMERREYACGSKFRIFSVGRCQVLIYKNTTFIQFARI